MTGVSESSFSFVSYNHPPPGQRAGGTHPTGMHSCYFSDLTFSTFPLVRFCIFFLVFLKVFFSFSFSCFFYPFVVIQSTFPLP